MKGQSAFKRQLLSFAVTALSLCNAAHANPKDMGTWLLNNSENKMLQCPKGLFEKQWEKGAYPTGFLTNHIPGLNLGEIPAAYTACADQVVKYKDIGPEKLFKYFESHPSTYLGKIPQGWLKSCGAELKSKLINTQIAEYFYTMRQIKDAQYSTLKAISHIDRLLGNGTEMKDVTVGGVFWETMYWRDELKECKPYANPAELRKQYAELTLDSLIMFKFMNQNKQADKAKIAQFQREASAMIPWINSEEFAGGNVPVIGVIGKYDPKITVDYSDKENSAEYNKALTEVQKRMVSALNASRKEMSKLSLKLATAASCYNNQNFNSSLCSDVDTLIASLPVLQAFDKNSDDQMEKVAAHYFSMVNDCRSLRIDNSAGAEVNHQLAMVGAFSAFGLGLGEVAAGMGAVVQGYKAAQTTARLAIMGNNLTNRVAFSVTGGASSAGYTSSLVSTGGNAARLALLARNAQIANNVLFGINAFNIAQLGYMGLDTAHVCASSLLALTPIQAYQEQGNICGSQEDSTSFQPVIKDFTACMYSATLNAGMTLLPIAAVHAQQLPAGVRSTYLKWANRGKAIKQKAEVLDPKIKQQRLAELERMRQQGREELKTALRTEIENARKVEEVAAPRANETVANNPAKPAAVKPVQTAKPAAPAKPVEPPKPRVLELSSENAPTYPTARTNKPEANVKPGQAKPVEPTTAKPAEVKPAVSNEPTTFEALVAAGKSDKNWTTKDAGVKKSIQDTYAKEPAFKELYESLGGDAQKMEELTQAIYYLRNQKPQPNFREVAKQIKAAKVQQENLPDSFEFQHSPQELSEAIMKYSTEKEYAEFFESIKGDKEMEDLLAEFILIHKKRFFTEDEIQVKLKKSFRDCGE